MVAIEVVATAGAVEVETEMVAVAEGIVMVVVGAIEMSVMVIAMPTMIVMMAQKALGTSPPS